MFQWASAFAESALNVSKIVGDLAGPCGFAICMGISRTLYGKFGDNLQAGVLAGIGFPIGLVICVLAIRKRYRE